MLRLLSEPVNAEVCSRPGNLRNHQNKSPKGLEGVLDAVLEECLPSLIELQDARPHYSDLSLRSCVATLNLKKLVKTVEQARSALTCTLGNVNRDT